MRVMTLVHTLTDMLEEVGDNAVGFTLRKKEAKALVNTLANSQREADFETLSNTLIRIQTLPRLRH